MNSKKEGAKDTPKQGSAKKPTNVPKTVSAEKYPPTTMKPKEEGEKDTPKKVSAKQSPSTMKPKEEGDKDFPKKVFAKKGLPTTSDDMKPKTEGEKDTPKKNERSTASDDTKPKEKGGYRKEEEISQDPPEVRISSELMLRNALELTCLHFPQGEQTTITFYRNGFMQGMQKCAVNRRPQATVCRCLPTRSRKATSITGKIYWRLNGSHQVCQLFLRMFPLLGVYVVQHRFDQTLLFTAGCVFVVLSRSYSSVTV